MQTTSKKAKQEKKKIMNIQQVQTRQEQLQYFAISDSGSDIDSDDSIKVWPPHTAFTQCQHVNVYLTFSSQPYSPIGSQSVKLPQLCASALSKVIINNTPCHFNIRIISIALP